MCIFSGSVSLVKGTTIFARRSTESKQFLVYGMNYEADQDMVMILPLPVGSHDEENAVRFINLDEYTSFFDDMLRGGFPQLMPALPRSSSGKSLISIVKPLKVHKVGNYNASFIPTLNDFDRLDPQFKLSREVWDQLPEYESYGFAVFKLSASSHSTHPMAFEFVTRSSEQLFFPTIHIHDGKVHQWAIFDHHLYYQGDYFSNVPEYTKVVQSEKIASEFMNVKKTLGIINGEQRCNAIVMSGSFSNQDIILATT
jgi:hypothetical protein